MTDGTSHAAVAAHIIAGLASGLTGIGLADKLVTVLLGLMSSLAIVMVQEHLRTRARRQALRERTERTPPPSLPPPPDDTTG